MRILLHHKRAYREKTLVEAPVSEVISTNHLNKIMSGD